MSRAKTAFLVGATTLLAFGNVAAQPKPATFTGKVFADTTHQPLVGVEVMLPELSKSATSNEKGAFTIRDIPPGYHLVQARRIGLAMFEARIEFKSGKESERAIVLPRISTLDSMKVVGEVNVPLSFLENRALGLGHFLTREDLAKLGESRLPSILSQVQGLGVVYGKALTNAYVMSSRRKAPIRMVNTPNKLQKSDTNDDDFYIPDEGEARQGIKVGCYARVYQGTMLLNTTSPAEPIDISQFMTQNIEAIEYYAGPAQTPSKYSRLGTGCGVLVIHMRK